jgi:hypothetical protein
VISRIFFAAIKMLKAKSSRKPPPGREPVGFGAAAKELSLPLKRIQNFAIALGVKDKAELNGLIATARSFATDLMEEIVKPEDLFEGPFHRAYYHDLRGVTFGINLEEKIPEEELDERFDQIQSKREMLLAYIAGVLGV